MEITENHFIRRDISFILYLLLALFLGIALLSYDAGDPAFFQQVKGYVVTNWEGFLGAHMAAFFFYFFGYGAYVLPLWFLYRASSCLKAADRPHKKAYLGILALFSGCLGLMSLHLAQDGTLPVGIGGYIGDQLTWQLTDWVDIVGTTLLLSGMMVIGLTTIFQIAWERLLSVEVSLPVRQPVERVAVAKESRRPVVAKLKKNKPAELSSDLLSENTVKPIKATPQEKELFSKEIEDRLADFGIEGHVVGVLEGPVVTRYEVALEAGNNVSRISTI